jgi:hypothetical protein
VLDLDPSTRWYIGKDVERYFCDALILDKSIVIDEEEYNVRIKERRYTEFRTKGILRDDTKICLYRDETNIDDELAVRTSYAIESNEKIFLYYKGDKPLKQKISEIFKWAIAVDDGKQEIILKLHRELPHKSYRFLLNVEMEKLENEDVKFDMEKFISITREIGETFRRNAVDENVVRIGSGPIRSSKSISKDSFFFNTCNDEKACENRILWTNPPPSIFDEYKNDEKSMKIIKRIFQQCAE